MAERPHDPGPVIFDLAVEVVLALNRTGVAYAVCGGLAVAAHGLLRATRDIDVLVAAETDVPAADAALAPSDWMPASAPRTFPGGVGLHRRLKPIGREMVVLDLLIQPPGRDWLGDRVQADVFGAAGFIVSRRVLVEMKRLAGRPHDLTDIDRLREGDG